ncbi:ABC transporter permease subunit [Halobellus sp. GM3]|uniref:ABC transporter permease subunit n=1 Tax=Halobellus sp. GM3 TaxID=3458410 RepID=UPI00403D8F7E
MSTRSVPDVSALLADPIVKVGVAFAAVTAVLPFVLSQSMLSLVTLAIVYAILGIGVVVSIGYSGQLVISQAAFAGIGAYTFVKVTAAGLPSWGGVVIATVLTTLIAGLLGATALRATGIYLGIITLAFNELFVILLNLFPGFFGGDAGISSPNLTLGLAAVGVPEYVQHHWIAALAFIGVFLVVRRILDSPYGWAFRSLHEKQIVSQSIGINNAKMRVLAFVLNGAVVGFGGALYAPFVGYISPSLFNLHATIDIFIVAIVGGLTLLSGSLIGGVFVIFIPELLRGIQAYDNVLFGLLLIFFLIYLPDGIGGSVRDFVRERRQSSASAEEADD